MNGLGGLVGTERRYATFSLTASTSRNCTISAPDTTPERQVFPPSVVTAKVPNRPLAHTTREFSALTAMRPAVVPLDCGVTFGPRGPCNASCCESATAVVCPLVAADPSTPPPLHAATANSASAQRHRETTLPGMAPSSPSQRRRS